jgi:hypothetical protein
MPDPTAAKRGTDKDKKDSDEISGKLVTWTKVVGVFTGLLFVATLCLFFATGMTAYFVWGQWNAAIDTQNDARKQLDAFVVFAGGTQIIGNDPQGKTLSYIFVTKFQNFGSTRTQHFAGWHSIHYFDKEIPNSQDFTKPVSAIDVYDTTIGPNTTYEMPAISITPDEAIKAKNKMGVVVIWGSVDWSGLYNNGQLFPILFCLKLEPVSSVGDERIVFKAIPLKPECNTGMKKING